MIQTAKNLVMDLQDAGCQVSFLIRDRDFKYPALIDAILADNGIESRSQCLFLNLVQDRRVWR